MKNQAVSTDYRKKNIANAALYILASLIIFGFLFFISYAGTKNDISLGDTAILSGWNFSHGNSPADLESSDGSQINFAKGLIASSKYRYFRLTKQIGANETPKYIDISPYFNQFSLRADGKVLFSNLSDSNLFGDTNRVVLELPPDSDGTFLDITVKIGFLPNIMMFLSDYKTARSPVTVNGLFGLLFSFLAALLSYGIIIYFFIKKRYESAFLVTAGFFACLIDILDRTAAYFDFGGLLYYKISFSAFILIGAVLFGRYLKLFKQTGGFFSKIITLGVLGSAIAATSSYLPLTIWIMRYFGIYFTVSAFVACLVGLLRKSACSKISRIEFFPLTLLMVSFSAYFLFFTFHIGYYTKQIFIATLLIQVFLQAIYIEYSEKNKVTQTTEQSNLMIYRPRNLGHIDSLLATFLQNPQNLYHVRNISLYVEIICRNAGFSPEKAESTARAAFLHDIGKLLISNETLQKDSVLTAEEYEQMKLHAQYGYDMLNSSDDEFLKTAAIIAKQHHERYDGNGYFGLKGEEIHPLAAITGIADVFDAVTARRHYKEAWSFDAGVQYILSNKETSFNPIYVDAFMRGFDEIKRVYCEVYQYNYDAAQFHS